MNNTKNVLVCGGCGFLGSHLVDKLLSLGHHVICVDNLSTGSLERISRHFNNPNFEFIRHNIWIPLYIECDWIFNMACAASPSKYQRDPIATTKTSVYGAINLLGIAKRTGARIFQASTSEIYGDPISHPQSEDDFGNVNPIGIRSCYDEGKRCAESLFFDYYRHHKVDIRVARIFNTYGPLMSEDDGRVVSNFITQALCERPITIFGNGRQTRSFCYVDDLIDGIIKFMSTDCVIGPLNIGNPTEITILELAEKVIRLCSSKSQLNLSSLPKDDPKRRRPDISRAKSSIDWEPTTDIEDGLKHTINYFRSRMGS